MYLSGSLTISLTFYTSAVGLMMTKHHTGYDVTMNTPNAAHSGAELFQYCNCACVQLIEFTENSKFVRSICRLVASRYIVLHNMDKELVYLYSMSNLPLQ